MSINDFILHRKMADHFSLVATSNYNFSFTLDKARSFIRKFTNRGRNQAKTLDRNFGHILGKHHYCTCYY